MAILDMIASGTYKRADRVFMLSSTIYKIDPVLFTGSRVFPGTRSIFVNERYKMFTGTVKEVYKEVQSKKEFCKIYDVILDVRGKFVRCYCIYFGYSGMICIQKGVRYELFDDVVNDEPDKNEDGNEDDNGRDINL